MSAKIHAMPVWKKHSTPGEWLGEVAGLALARPERFGRIIVIAEELDESGCAIAISTYDKNVPTGTLQIGILQMAILDEYDRIKGRREQTP